MGRRDQENQQHSMLYLMKSIKNYQKNIITLEDPIEIEKDYCLQIELNEKQGINYNESLKQILRHDPDVIMIGEIRDETTAQLALTCALTGHLVLTTLHASHCINTLKRLVNLNIPVIRFRRCINWGDDTKNEHQ